MGASSSSQSTSTSQDYTDSFNQNLTNSLSGQSVGFNQTGGDFTANGLSYNYDSGNYTSTSNLDYSLGANSSSGGNSGSGTGLTSGFDYSTLLPWALGAAALFFLFTLLKGGK